MKPYRLLDTYRHFAVKARSEQLDAEALALVTHDVRMTRGCLVCGTAVPGRVCPDCYTCRACGAGCDDCIDLRPRLPPPFA
jgi:hypothetical protein